ncbi:uncharacterized protein LOC144559399 [Carex rostrata]
MHYFTSNFLLLLLLIQAFSANCCIEHERDALLEFKAGVNDINNRLASWKGEKCCNWVGIQCSNQTGHVVKLNLRNTDIHLFKYYEYIFSYWSYHSLTGKINPSLQFLSDLKHLDLSCNDFNGTKFPNFIGSFRNLKYLNLSNTGLSGKIPPKLGNLSRLLYFDLSYNEFSSFKLHADTWWLSNLRSLKHMDMSGVIFQDSNNWVKTLNRLSSLEVLVLSRNNLTQISNTLPFVNFTSLIVLHLSYQNFDTTIPKWVGNLTSLNKLALDYNSLHGMVPSLHSLTQLTHLSLPGNNIEGDIDELLLGKLSNYTLRKLEYLDISSTNLTGTLTGWIGDMTSVTYLSLSYNHLRGKIPINIGNLTNLVFLDLSENSLTGLFGSDWTPSFQLNVIWLSSCKLGPKFPSWLRRQVEIEDLDLSDTEIDDSIPDWFSSLSSLRILVMSNNMLRGKLPPSLVHMTKLKIMFLSNNQLEGNISFLPTSLAYVDLSNNSLSGHLPLWWSNISRELNLADNRLSGVVPSSLSCSGALAVVKLENNSLTGEFPFDLKFCTRLELLDLGENNFHGIIPDWVGERFYQLQFLRLRSNLFSSNIPSKLTLLNNLQFLDLANNNLSGPLPSGLDHFTSMIQLSPANIGYIGESLNVMAKGLILKYEHLGDLKSIDLSNNNLIGEIPQEIVVLAGLWNLNLSHNHLMGNIPQEIGNMTSLESLDLRMNNLSGTIPQSMSALYSLAVLNFSYNNLSGSIPTGYQLQTLDDPSIYSDNPYLCGPPLKTSCRSSDGNNNPNSKNSDNNDKWLYLFIEFGFVTGLMVLFFILLLKANWRYTYFQMVDDVFDRLASYML